MFKNKTILITGGTGSFGKTIVNKFIDTNINEIRVLSRDEKKQEDMRISLNNKKLKFYIGDVRDYSSLSDSLDGVDFVFHAAALKQVPSCEFYPMEAYKTNVVGTDNLLKAAQEKGVNKVIVLSTDKAVYPINAMGISKAMAEKIVTATSRKDIKSPVFCCTRYGNVMGSRGSVIPLFVSQILNDEAITITDPHMTRFLMSLDQSVDLVMYAFENALSGDIFVQKASSCTINDLVIALKEIFNSSSKVRIIGTRHGEKLYESPLSRDEMASSKKNKNYFRIPPDLRDLNYSKYIEKGNKKISIFKEYSSHNTKQLDKNEMKKLLMKVNCIKNILKSINGK